MLGQVISFLCWKPSSGFPFHPKRKPSDLPRPFKALTKPPTPITSGDLRYCYTLFLALHCDRASFLFLGRLKRRRAPFHWWFSLLGILLSLDITRLTLFLRLLTCHLPQSLSNITTSQNSVPFLALLLLFFRWHLTLLSTECKCHGDKDCSLFCSCCIPLHLE